MQILKFERIKNVGQIKDYTASGDVAFKKFNTIYGENAVGKTTLATIFRALKTGDVTAVGLKKTLGVPEPVEQEVQVKVNDGERERVFLYKTPNNWQAHKIPEIEIFDAYFVEKNILSGWQCSTEHQKNLPTLILGEEGIKQAIDLERYKKELNETIPGAENRIKDEIIKQNSDFFKAPFGRTRADEFLKKFYNMPKPDDGYDYDKHIEETKNRIKILEALSNNPERQPFKKLTVPEFDKDYFVNQILHKTLETLSKDAETKVKEHAHNFGMPNASWLVQGRQFLGDKEVCPFCGQSTSNIDLVSSYKAYFSEEYRNFANSLKAYNGLDVFEENRVTELVNSILMNAEIRRAFNGGITDNWPKIRIDELKASYEELLGILKSAYDKKKSAVLERVDLPEVFDASFLRFSALVEQFKAYNIAIEDTNAKLSGLNPDDLEGERNRLLAINLQKSRYCVLNELAETEVRPLIDKRQTVATAYKTLLESFRTNATEFKDKYEASINEFLEKFGVNFRVQITPANLRTSKPSYDFGIIIDNCNDHVVAARPRTSFDEELCMGNALSEGDKTTLAFAFFLAQLNQSESDLSDKIIVIDDPISSLDKHRRLRTISIIVGLLPKVSQLFVVSHDEFFLKECFSHKSTGNNSEKKSLQLFKDVDSARLINCDLIELTKSAYVRNYDLLVDYTRNPAKYDINTIPNKIRAYLEGLLRMMYPHEFIADETLGVYLGQIARTPDHKLNRVLSELNYLNDFGNIGSHDSGQPPITNTETMVAVKGALGMMDKLILNNTSQRKEQAYAVTSVDVPLKGWKR